MKNVVLGLFIAGSIAGVAVPVFADEVNRVAEIIVEEDAEAKAIQERKESTVAKTVITTKEMEELGGQTAADVLRRLPRIYLSGPPSSSKDARMAGLDKEFQNILINGNRPPGGGEKREFALDRIPVEQIERIEVLKNPDASFDSDAIAGVINIILKEPPRKRSLAVSASGALNDQADKVGNKFTIAYGDALGPLGLAVVGTRNDEVRSKLKTVENTVKNELESENEEVRTITSSLNPTFTLQLGKSDKLSFKPYFTESREKKNKEKLVANLAIGAAKSKNVEQEDKNQFLQSYALEWDHRFAAGSSLKLQGLFSRNDETKDKTTAQFTGNTLAFSKNIFEREDKDDLEKVLGADFKMPFSGPFDSEHLLTTGVKFRDKDRSVVKTVTEVNSAGAVKTTSTPNDSYQVDETITAVYLMDEALVTDKLTLLPGFRVEITDGRYATSGGNSGSGSFVDLNPSFHARYKLPWDMVLRGSLARTIARPAFKDKVPTRSVKADKVEEGNPDLKAATSMNYEAAIEKYFGKSAYMSVGAFYKAIEDTIEKQEIGLDGDTGLPVLRPVNVGDATVKGLDVEVKSQLAFIGLPQVMVMGSYSLLTSQVRDVNTGEKRRLVDQPNMLANVTVRYDSKALGLALATGMTHVGRKVNANDAKTEEPYTQWDVSATKSLYKGVSLFASALNIFNEKKQVTKPGITEREEVGRTFYAGLRFEL